MRNRLIHDYIGIDLQIVWSVIKSELPSFQLDLEKIYAVLKDLNR